MTSCNTVDETMTSITARIDRLSPVLDGTPVLQKTEVSFNGGAISCLVGPSGSGKSTLLRLLSGDHGLQFSGLVRYHRNGREHGLRDTSRAGQLSILVPEAVLPPWLTIREILQIPARLNKNLSPPSTQAIAHELKALKLDDSVINKRPGDLSMGMHHRVLLAFFFLYSPAHVFIDELFSALDPPTSEMAMKRLKARVKREKATCIITTHDLELAEVHGDYFYYKYGKRPEILQLGDRGGSLGGKLRKSLRRLFDEEYSQPDTRHS